MTDIALKSRILRRGERADEAEFVRLFHAMAAESGIEDFNIDKVRAMFDRAIRRDRAALVVAGEPGHLQGVVLFGFQYPWFADSARMTMLSVFLDPDHRGLMPARELLRFSRQPIRQQEAALHLLSAR
jgi:hypothetical protein